jgi:hypothetical protein
VGEGTGIRLFVNGTLVLATDVGAGLSLTSSSSRLELGEWAGGGGGYFIGAYDQVLIFDTALSDAEVALLSAPEPSLVALLGFGLLLVGWRRRINLE